MQKDKVSQSKKPVYKVTTENKILKELKHMNDTLIEIKDIMDNIWRERRPQ